MGMITNVTEGDFDPDDLVVVHLHAPGLGIHRVASSNPEESWTNPVGIPQCRRPSDGSLAAGQYVVSGIRAMIAEAVREALGVGAKEVEPSSLDEPKRGRGRPKGSKNKATEATACE